MFKRMLSAFGVGGPSVDTVLDSSHAVPGQAITGQVRIQGGGADVEIDQVVLSLVTTTSAGQGGADEFFRTVVQKGVRVPADQLVSLPFQLVVPWEAPITVVGGAPLPGMSVGVRTELLIEGSPVKSDLDPVTINPLPAQNKVLDAFGALGFSFRGTGVDTGRVHGSYQRVEFFPPAQFAGRVNQVELTFVATADELQVVLDTDKRGQMPAADGDALGRFRFSHEEAQGTDWGAAINEWLAQVVERGQTNAAFGGQNSAFSAQPAGNNPAFGGQPASQNAAFGGQASSNNPAFTAQPTGHNPAFSGQPSGHNAAFSTQSSGHNPAFTSQPAAFNTQPAGHNRAFGGQPGYGHSRYDGYDHHDRRGHHDQPGQRRGAGMGGMLAAGAAGAVGGLVLGQMAEGLFDDEG